MPLLNHADGHFIRHQIRRDQYMLRAKRPNSVPRCHTLAEQLSAGDMCEPISRESAQPACLSPNRVRR